MLPVTPWMIARTLSAYSARGTRGGGLMAGAGPVHEATSRRRRARPGELCSLLLPAIDPHRSTAQRSAPQRTPLRTLTAHTQILQTAPGTRGRWPEERRAAKNTVQRLAQFSVVFSPHGERLSYRLRSHANAFVARMARQRAHTASRYRAYLRIGDVSVIHHIETVRWGVADDESGEEY